MSLHHMLRAAAGRNTPAPPASNDPKFNYVALLLHGDGTNGAQNNTFIDSSTNNFTITRNGNTTQGSLSPYGNLWSNYFDSNTTYLSFPSNTASNFGSSNFTFECWYYPMHTTGDANLFWWNGDPSGNNGWAGMRLQFNTWNGRTVSLLCSESASTWNVNVTTGTVYSPNTWFHVAVVRNGATVTAYLNGTSIASGNLSSSGASLYAGTENLINNMVYPAGTRTAGGRANISNVRMLKGTALYTSNFTPPTAPLTAITNTALLTCQSNRFIDNSANNFTITRNGDVRVTKESPFLPTAAYSTSTIGGSGYFDGTSDYLTFDASSSAAFGTGAFTVEGWFYLANTTGTKSILDCRPTQTAVPWGFEFAGGAPSWYNGSSNTSSTSVTANTWNHVAVVREGTGTNQTKIYVNGVVGLTYTDATNYGTMNTAARIGGGLSNVNWFFGNISNLRIVKGTAVYTSAFTPPTAPLTAITNTSLLLNFTNAGIFDNAAENNLETVGNAQISTSVKKYGTGSLAFDGNGDGLVAAGLSPTLVNYDFTWECWVNFSSLSGGPCLINVGTSSTNRTLLYFDATNGIRYAVDRSGVSQVSIQQGSTTGWSTGVWYHVALVRSGNTYTIYRDGISVASGTSTYAQSIFTTGFNIGFSNTSPFFLYFNGYIDDVRITNGYARYTANFTPPTAAFPDQ